MAFSLAVLVLLCLLVDSFFTRLKIPPLVGMLGIGFLLGPQLLNQLDPSLLVVGSDLRLVALIVILLRSGFELSAESVRKVGLQAVLLSFVPALFEATSVMVLAPILLDLGRMESLLLGCVLAAVSPAVVVPAMVQLIKEQRGAKKGLPTLVLAGASMDDVTVIVAYSIVLGLYLGDSVSIAWSIAGIPLGIALGLLSGIIIGLVLIRLFVRFNPRATKRALIVLGISIVLVHGSERLKDFNIPFAALLSVMAIGFIILLKKEHMAHELSSKFGKIWVFAQIVLFTMVGAQVDFSAVRSIGLSAVVLILLALVFRSIGTFLCTLGAGFTAKEKLFVVISYLPKATVQAAIGAAPLYAMSRRGMDTSFGELVLAVAVLAILITAPLGAFAISWAGRNLLSIEVDEIAAIASIVESE